MRSVLVTGASTGIGRATALRLDAAGWRVFAGVRREADADSLREAGSERARAADARHHRRRPDRRRRGADRARAATAGLDGLVNNAGIGVPGPLETLPMEDFRRQVEVNLIGHVAVTKAMLPAIRRARGRIVFISSIGGRIAFPMNGAYHVAKFGIEAAGDVFRQELRPWGISVSIVEPGSIDTPIWERSEREIDSPARARTRSPRSLYGKQVAAVRKVEQETRRAGDRAREGRPTDRARAQRPPSPRPLPGRARRQAPGAGEVAHPDAGLGPDRRPHDRLLSPSGAGKPRLAPILSRAD